VVVHTASVTATRLMLAVLANATVAAEGRTTLVAALLETSRHLLRLKRAFCRDVDYTNGRWEVMIPHQQSFYKRMVRRSVDARYAECEVRRETQRQREKRLGESKEVAAKEVKGKHFAGGNVWKVRV
jgi:hypothetical protein